MYSFDELFGGFIDVSASPLAGAQIEHCELDEDARTIEIVCQCDRFIGRDALCNLKNVLKTALQSNDIRLQCRYPADCFNEEACADLTGELRLSHAALNGYFNGAQYRLEGDTVHIALKYGGIAQIERCDFRKRFSALTRERFGRTVTVEFEGQLTDVEMELPPAPPEPPVRERRTAQRSAGTERSAAPERKIEFEERLDKPENGLVYLDDPRLFYGRSISADTIPMVEIGEESENQTISCWGEVFGYETKEFNGKFGPGVTVKFSFSDHTNSLNAVLFANKSRMGELSPLKDGAFVLVNGEYQKRVRNDGGESEENERAEYVLKVKALALLQKYEERDGHEGVKRVELHCHTNMSAKDAVSSAEDIVRRAYNWGHKAVAITDHGVVQAYPLAAKAVKDIRKGGGDFKVIYGVEAYFVDDTRVDISAMNAKEIKKIRYHQIILVKNMTGLKNLYKLISEAHLKDFCDRPITLRSKLDGLREGLLLGSACEQGELYHAIVDGAAHEELVRIARYYDYLEIQPIGNNAFMVRESAKPERTDKKTGQVIPNRFRHVTSEEVIREFNRTVVALGDELGIPVVATGDVHFLRKDDGVIRQIVMAGQGYDDIENQAPLYFKTTDEMLADFDYFGDRAREFVIDNPNRIADMIDGDVIPVPEGNYPPVIQGSDEQLREICWEKAHRIYGDPVPEIVEKRLKRELDSIINNGFSIMYISAQRLVAYSEANGYLVGSRGSVGSSFVATMAGISEVNPLAPHYVCPNCRHSEFFTDGSVGSGFDLPEKDCPECGAAMRRDGHDIPFETFLGFKGDKVPDIDLNFSDEVQNSVQKYTEELFGPENVFKAGTVTTIAEKTAYGFSKAYAEKMGIKLSGAELDRLAQLVEKSKVKQTTGQHPAGMIVVPRDKTIYDFCPVQHPADDVNSDIVTTHFEFKYIHDTILKLDELGHVIPTTYKYLEEYSGIPVNDVSMSDQKVYSLFTSTEALGVTPDEIDYRTGTIGLPEFGTNNTRDMLLDCKPKNFADLLQISGLSHGTNVWHGNAKDLIDNGICTISEVIGTRDNIMMYLIHKGMDEGRAFKITETVRKGLVAKGQIAAEVWDEMAEDMRAIGVPEWYIESCRKIEYMFPKAHAAAYVISALRVAWYKVYRPLEFYCAYFTARPDDVDVQTIMEGHAAVRRKMNEIRDKGREAAKKEHDVFGTLQIFNEMMARGIEVLPIDVQHSHAMKFLPENGRMRLPFGALSGVGEKAAYAIYEAAQRGNYISREDFAVEAGVSKTIIKNLADLGALNDLPETNQISMF